MSAGSAGNRVWLTSTPAGPVILKVYRVRRGPVREWFRVVGTSLRNKSSPSPRGRRDTERLVLRRWREAGFDVPREVSVEHPDLAGPDRLLLEALSGPTLHAVLRGLGRRERDPWLRRFAAAWGRRHAHALATGDPTFVQEHGSFQHVLVHGSRLVTIDHEQVYTAGADVQALLVKEILGYVRSLEHMAGGSLLEGDLRALLAGYDDPSRVEQACARALTPGPLQATLQSFENTRRSQRKRRLKELLHDAARRERQQRSNPSGAPARGRVAETAQG